IMEDGRRRLEIVSGRGNQIYASGSLGVRSPVRTSTSSSRPWGGLNDPKSKRRKRIAKYKAYTIEGRVKASFRNGIRWIKSKCSEFIHGY
ncbi:FAR1-related sequence 11-like protein, partial [Tanacetum coccineum]